MPRFQSRLILRLKDAIDKPEFWQRRIDAETLAEKRAAWGLHAVFNEVPQEHVERYLSKLADTVESIRAAGAMPILVTHAIGSHDLPTPADLRMLESFLQHTPRATPQILLDYEAAVRSGMLEYAADNNVAIVDLAAELNGRHEAFGDLVHFTNVGAEVAAQAIARKIVESPAK